MPIIYKIAIGRNIVKSKLELKFKKELYGKVEKYKVQLVEYSPVRFNNILNIQPLQEVSEGRVSVFIKLRKNKNL